MEKIIKKIVNQEWSKLDGMTKNASKKFYDVMFSNTDKRVCKLIWKAAQKERDLEWCETLVVDEGINTLEDFKKTM